MDNPQPGACRNAKAGQLRLFFTIFGTATRLRSMKRILLLLPFFVMGKPAGPPAPADSPARNLLARWHYFSSTLHSGSFECMYRHAENADTITRQCAVVFSGNTGTGFSCMLARCGNTQRFLECDSGSYCISEERKAYWITDKNVSHPSDRFYSRTVQFNKLGQLLRSTAVTFKMTGQVNGQQVNGPAVLASWPNGQHTDSAVFVFHPENEALERMVLYTHSDFVKYYDDVRITAALCFPRYSRRAYMPAWFTAKWAEMKLNYEWF